MDIEKIVLSDKFKHSNKGFGYKDDDDIRRPLCFVLSQMSRYIKYRGNDRKNMSFVIEDDIVLINYNEIWRKN